MTTIEQGLYTYLTGGSPNPVAALVGTRVYPMGHLPQNPTMPALSYSLIGAARVVTTDGADTLFNPSFQVDCWHTSGLGAVQLFDLVRQRLNGFSGDLGGVYAQGIFLVRARDLYDNDTGLYRRSADYSIWNREPV